MRRPCETGEREASAGLIRQVLRDNPFTTLQVIQEPALPEPGAPEDQLPPPFLEFLLGVCQETPTYLDKFYALQPGRANGAKRLIVLLPLAQRPAVDPGWLEEIAAYTTLVWRGTGAKAGAEEDMEAH